MPTQPELPRVIHDFAGHFNPRCTVCGKTPMQAQRDPYAVCGVVVVVPAMAAPVLVSEMAEALLLALLAVTPDAVFETVLVHVKEAPMTRLTLTPAIAHALRRYEIAVARFTPGATPTSQIELPLLDIADAVVDAVGLPTIRDVFEGRAQLKLKPAKADLPMRRRKVIGE